MSPHDQQIAIAEACGWRFYQVGPDDWEWLMPHPDDIGQTDPRMLRHQMMPDYLNDRNAMHRAWATLSRAERMSFYNVLVYSVLHRRQPPITLYDIFDAMPAEWAEAFLRVKGLWKETPAS